MQKRSLPLVLRWIACPVLTPDKGDFYDCMYTQCGIHVHRLLFLRQIFPPDLDAFFLLSSHKSAICRDPRGVMLLSTLPPVWEGHLQGLENPGLRRIGTGQARHAVGLIQGRGEQTETMERSEGVRDRDAMRRVLRGAQHSRQAPLQLAAALQREQTHEDRTAGPPCLADEDRTYVQQPGRHRADVVCDVRQVLRAIVGRVRIAQGRGHVSLEDIPARQLHGVLWRCRITVDREAAPVKTDRDDGGKLVALDPGVHLPQPGRGVATRGGRNLGLPGGHECLQGVPFLLEPMPGLPGFGGIVPQDVPPALGVHFRDLLGTLSQLDHAPLEERAALRLGQRRDVPEALRRSRGFALGLHPPPSADEHHLGDVQARLEDGHGRGHGARVGHMACTDPHREGRPGLIGQPAHDHVALAFFPVPMGAIRAEVVLFACQGAAGDSIQTPDGRAALALHGAPRERLRDVVLPLGDRLQGAGAIVLVKAAHAQDLAYRLLLCPAHRRQPRAWVRHPGQSQQQTAFAWPPAPQHARDAQVIRHVLQRIKDTKDRTTDGVPTREMIACAPESPTQGLHAHGLPMGQVGQGALADLVTVTKRLAP